MEGNTVILQSATRERTVMTLPYRTVLVALPDNPVTPWVVWYEVFKPEGGTYTVNGSYCETFADALRAFVGRRPRGWVQIPAELAPLTGHDPIQVITRALVGPVAEELSELVDLLPNGTVDDDGAFDLVAAAERALSDLGYSVFATAVIISQAAGAEPAEMLPHVS